MDGLEFVGEVITGIASNTVQFATSLASSMVAAVKTLFVEGTGDSASLTVLGGTIIAGAVVGITIAIFRKATHVLRLKRRA